MFLSEHIHILDNYIFMIAGLGSCYAGKTQGKNSHLFLSQYVYVIEN